MIQQGMLQERRYCLSAHFFFISEKSDPDEKRLY